MLTAAIPKGRMGAAAIALFGGKKTNVGRKLVYDDPSIGIRFLFVKPSDAPIYVERGAADIGVVGRDTLLEFAPNIFELAELPIGRCDICVAAREGFRDDPALPIRVATKYPNIARDHFNNKNRRVDIIRLSGSIELAPILDMSDVIVDIVETGETLRENRLTVIEYIAESRAVLTAGKAAFRFKQTEIAQLLERLKGDK